jgi:serine/threonine protein kinase
MKCPECDFDNPDNTRFCGQCASPLPHAEEEPFSSTETLRTPIKELAIGTTFARRYQIIEELGKGGMGKVYKALDREVEEKVALKLIKPEIAAEEKTIKRFRNELRFARKISHKNVCRMFDLNKEGDTHYITMEYVPGEDLKSSLRRMGPLSVGKAVIIAKQVCEGLEEAHRLGVVHRDLKPQNIMIDREGNARIMDFGIARSLEAKGITEEGLIIGTPEYMSPEQVEGKKVDQRSDVYSMGVILYEMVTGRVPFEGKTPLSVASKHMTQVPVEPRELNAQIPEDLSRVIMKCMEKEKEGRYQGTVELLSDLKKIEKGIPSTERIVPEKKPLTSKEITLTFGLKKVLIPAVVIVAVVIIGIVIWRFILQPEVSETSMPQPPAAKIEEYSTAGNKYWKNKNYSEAFNQFKKILEIEPKNFEAQLSLASVLKEQGKTDKAIQEFENAIDLNKEDPRSYRSLGELFEQKQESDKIVLYYKKYLEVSPKAPDFQKINQLVKNIEAQLHPPVKQDKSAPEPTVAKKEKVDISSKLNLGIKAFDRERFDQCVKQMEEVLKLDPENTTAQYYLTEAKKRRKQNLIEQEISNRVKMAQNAYQKGDYQECINQARRVLRLDPNNVGARECLQLANLKIAPVQINAVVNQYIQSLNNKNLSTFFKNSCSSELYQRLKIQAEMITNSYDNFKSVASNINIRFKENNQAEVSFSNITTGVLSKDGRKQVIFEGVYIWDMEKRGDSWMIKSITARPIEKK